jgi:hypothetical protein
VGFGDSDVQKAIFELLILQGFAVFAHSHQTNWELKIEFVHPSYV